MAIGYGDPLPASSPAVQATLASLRPAQIHKFIQEQHKNALLDRDDDGEHAPLLLVTLDLSQWTLILNLTIRELPEKALAQLQTAHSQLAELLDWENDELIQAEKDAATLDAALKAANPHETAVTPTSVSGQSTLRTTLSLVASTSRRHRKQPWKISLRPSKRPKQRRILHSSWLRVRDQSHRLHRHVRSRPR